MDEETLNWQRERAKALKAYNAVCRHSDRALQGLQANPTPRTRKRMVDVLQELDEAHKVLREFDKQPGVEIPVPITPRKRRRPRRVANP